MRWRLFLSGLLLLSVEACDLPTDQRGTLDRVQNSRIYVGVIENWPWATLRKKQAEGVEADLVKAFADTLNAKVEWIGGGFPALSRALEVGQIDLLIGGLTSRPPAKERLGLSTIYFRTTSRVATPPGARTTENLKAVTIAARPQDPAAAELPGNVSVRWTDDLRSSQLPILAQDWEIAAWGYMATRFVAAHTDHVIAVSPGENAFLRRLDLFLRDKKEVVPSILKDLAKR